MKIFAVTIISICILSLWSCKNNDSPAPEPSTSIGVFILHLHTNIGNNEVDDLDSVYTTDEGRKMSLSFAQLYVSDIEVIKADGSAYAITGKKILKTYENEQYILGDLPTGNYKTIRFKVGLDATTNSQDAATSPYKAILNFPEMWFGNTSLASGYVFVNVQGTIDSSAGMNGTPVPFTFKIGTNANYETVTLPDSAFTIVKDQAYYEHVVIDYGKLFDGLDLTKADNLMILTPADNTTPQGITVAGNVASMFKYE